MLRIVCCLALLAVARPAQGAPTVYLSQAPACPNAELLREALRAHLTRFEVTGEPTAQGVPVEVVDLGRRYRVVVNGIARDFDDAARNCAERAAAATVFAALVLEPPALAEPDPAASPDAVAQAQPATGAASAAPPVAPVPAPMPAPSPAPGRRRHRLELQVVAGSGVGYVPAGAHTDVAWASSAPRGDVAGQYARETLGSGGAAYAPLHVGVAASLRLTRRWSVGLYARIGFPLIDNADSTADPPLGSGSAHAVADFALLARARLLLGQGRAHPFFTFGLGGGWIDHVVNVTSAGSATQPLVDAHTAAVYGGVVAPGGSPVNRVCPLSGSCYDTVRVGDFLVSASAGGLFDLVHRDGYDLGFLVELQATGGALPDGGVTFDLHLGLEAQLF